jgi:hypothetical protein
VSFYHGWFADSSVTFPNILELGRLLIRELRCIGRTHEQHERVPVKLHAANVDQAS